MSHPVQHKGRFVEQATREDGTLAVVQEVSLGGLKMPREPLSVFGMTAGDDNTDGTFPAKN